MVEDALAAHNSSQSSDDSSIGSDSASDYKPSYKYSSVVEALAGQGFTEGNIAYISK